MIPYLNRYLNSYIILNNNEIKKIKALVQAECYELSAFELEHNMK